MFEKIIDEVSLIANGLRLDEAISPEEFEKFHKELSTPDIRPCPFDITFAAWMHRIGLWGKVKILHDDPEYGLKEDLTPDRFLKQMEDDSEIVRQLGKWKIEELAINKMQLYRIYTGLNGKKWTEKYVVTIDLKPELKKALR